MPKPPGGGKKIGAEAFFKYTGSELDESRDWPHLVCYVYRLWPVLKEKTYIDKISMPFDGDYILREWGSGTYKFSLNDQNIKAQFRTVCWMEWTVRDPDRPPVIPDLGRVSLTDPANKDYVQKLIREGKLDTQGNIPPPPQNAAADSTLSQTVRDAMNKLLQAALEQKSTGKHGDASEALEKGMEMLQKAHERSMDMLQRHNDPSGMLQLLQTLKELIPKAEPQANPANVLKEIVGLVRELVPQSVAATPQSSVASQLKELVEVMAAVREMSGAAEPIRTGKLTWPDVIMNAVPMIPNILSQAASLFWAARSAAPGQAATAGNPPSPAVRQPSGPADGNPTAGQPAIAAPPGAESDDPAVMQLAQFLPVIAQPLVNALNNGQSGADFADWIAGGYGQTVYGAIAQMRPDQIRAALERTPALAPVLRSLPQGALDQFIAEFLNPALADEDGSPATAAVQ